jgi:hypothetical protein
MYTINKEHIDSLKRAVLGKRVKFIAHAFPDPQPLPTGLEGTITAVDDIGTIHVKWDNGRTLGLTQDGDEFEILN